MPLPTTRPLPLDTSDRGSLEDIAHVLQEHPGTIVLSGAGISTASGIPDYRGPDGTRRVEPMTYAAFLSGSPARQRYWARSYVGWPRFRQARPNRAHAAVTTLQRAGLLGDVITQNVDGLHQASGSHRVIDLHGRLSRVICLDCGDTSERDVLQERMAEDNAHLVRDPAAGDAAGSQWGEVRPDGDVDLADAWIARFATPTCRSCGGDRLKPDVVFFGESVPRTRVLECTERVEQASAMLVLGSSLSVMSGLRFVRQAHRRGIPVGIVTLSGTRGDEFADLRIHRPLEDALARVVALVG